MRYEIVYGEHAFDDLLDLEPPDAVVDCIERWILLLASQPVEHSYRDASIFPWGQVFDFSCPDEPEAIYYCRAMFHYMQNEAEIRLVELRVEKRLLH
ncbi:MAG: hypothetical protein HY000_27270 [Planctomycetes bacterium]|nr:hypothetical protein [Planctomycetota bacterium]